MKKTVNNNKLEIRMAEIEEKNRNKNNILNPVSNNKRSLSNFKNKPENKNNLIPKAKTQIKNSSLSSVKLKAMKLESK